MIQEMKPHVVDTTTTTVNNVTQARDYERSTLGKVPSFTRDSFTLADSVAAVTIAILASTVLITVICIVRLLRKRRQQQQGDQLNRIPAIYASTIGANVMAYHNLQMQMQNDPLPEWEPVQVQSEGPTTPSTTAPTPSTSYSIDDEVPVISIITIHNDIQRQQNHINAGFVPDNGE